MSVLLAELFNQLLYGPVEELRLVASFVLLAKYDLVLELIIVAVISITFLLVANCYDYLVCRHHLYSILS